MNLLILICSVGIFIPVSFLLVSKTIFQKILLVISILLSLTTWVIGIEDSNLVESGNNFTNSFVNFSGFVILFILILFVISRFLNNKSNL